MPDHRFRPCEHLKRESDFRLTFDRKRSVSDEWLIVYARENNLAYNRLGLSVSRKVGPAVVRNKVRRLYREAFRLTKNELPTGMDLILIPRGQKSPTLVELMESLRKLVPLASRKLARDDKSK
jgi:ribonuclease P protein component